MKLQKKRKGRERSFFVIYVLIAGHSYRKKTTYFQNLKNVIMTPIKQSGYKFYSVTILLLIVFLSGCSVTNKSFTSNIKEVKDAYYEVFSPEKKFYIKMYGDYAITDKMSKKDLKNALEIVNQLSLDMNLRRNFLLKGTTTVSPFYKNLIFMNEIIDILPKKSDNELFIFVYKETEHQQYGALAVPLSIYYSAGKKFYFQIPSNESVLILVKNWHNEILHSIRMK